MKSIYKIIILGIGLIANLVYADAGIYLNFENNCKFNINFNLSNDNDTINNNYLVAPQQYSNQMIDAGKLSTKNSANFQVSTINGSLKIKLSNNLSNNSIKFSNLNHLTTNLVDDSKEFTWHALPVVGSFVGTPTFTITACPNNTLDLSRSEILQNIKRILIFGDSLSDNGNLIRADAGILPKSAPYYNGQFSNGNSWAEQFKKAIVPTGINFSNYAMGGAMAVLDLNPSKEKLPYSLNGEYDVYQQDNNNFSEPAAQRLGIILIGANDYLNLDQNMNNEQVEQKVKQVINDGIAPVVKKLIANGVKKFIFVDLPNIGTVPECEIDNDCQILQTVSLIHNQYLAQMLIQLAQQYGSSYNFTILKISDLFALAINSPQQFNKLYNTSIENVNTQCWSGGYSATVNQKKLNLSSKLNPQNIILPNNSDIVEAYRVANGGTVCTNPNKYLFWDRVHPTYQIHKVFFLYFLQQIGAKFNN